MPAGEPLPTPTFDVVRLVWLTGPSCDGCTISAIGDDTAGGLESLLAHKVAGLPRVEVIHPALSFDYGDRFVEQLRRASSGELDPFALIVEASIPDERRAGEGFFSALGEENGRPIPIAEWVDRLAPRAAVVIAFGDCGVWGGPHSLEPNPVGSTGVGVHLGADYRSTLGLPVINLPGCCAPPVLISTLATVITHAQGNGPPLELDDTNRPCGAYPEVWPGALAVWAE